MGKRRRKPDREVSAGGIVFRRQEDLSARFLLIRDPYQHWGFPKGHLEGEETPAETALRETAEETGLSDLQLHGPIRIIDWQFRFRGRYIHKFCHFFLFESPAAEVVPQADEGITDHRWLTLEEAFEQLSYDNARTVLKRAGDMARTLVAVGAGRPPREVGQALQRSLPPGGAWRLVSCGGLPQLERTLRSQLVDAIVFPPHRMPFAALTGLRQSFPHIPWIAFGPFRPDDGLLMLAAVTGGVTLALVEGVDNAVAGELVARHSATAFRRRALAGADRLLRLSGPLQQLVWARLLERPDRPIRTTQLAALVGCTREHLSREFGAGGAPNLKRVIDLTRVVCAASLLTNPGYDARAVALILRFASASHLTATSRRIAGVPAARLPSLGVSGIVAAFARGATRSRL